MITRSRSARPKDDRVVNRGHAGRRTGIARRFAEFHGRRAPSACDVGEKKADGHEPTGWDVRLTSKDNSSGSLGTVVA